MSDKALESVQKSPARSILDMDCGEAAAFLLKGENYCRIELPGYFSFDGVLADVTQALEAQTPPRYRHARQFERVNHPILSSKDGKYAWRPLQLIHPVLYAALVQVVTNPESWSAVRSMLLHPLHEATIRCLSIPLESLSEEDDKAMQVRHWWEVVEQVSVETALTYEIMAHADVVDCYGSIYTHSIPWAIHGKETSQKNKTNPALFGNLIDWLLQDMHLGQTNGIPQGSVMMDFLSELVLNLADRMLAEELKKNGITDYLVLRYRDDYRIFVHDSRCCEAILKCLTEVLVALGLRLNAAKTKTSGDVVRDSIKPDKLAWLTKNQRERNLQKHLLAIFAHSLEFPNSGSVQRALTEYYQRLAMRTGLDDPLALVSIATDIAYRSPRSYPVCAAIISKCLSALDSDDQRHGVAMAVLRRFRQLPNTGQMEIWLQRISMKCCPDIDFLEPLCRLVQGHATEIWNSEWLHVDELRQAVDAQRVFDPERAAAMDSVVTPGEVELFTRRGWYY